MLIFILEGVATCHHWVGKLVIKFWWSILVPKTILPKSIFIKMWIKFAIEFTSIRRFESYKYHWFHNFHVNLVHKLRDINIFHEQMPWSIPKRKFQTWIYYVIFIRLISSEVNLIICKVFNKTREKNKNEYKLKIRNLDYIILYYYFYIIPLVGYIIFILYYSIVVIHCTVLGCHWQHGLQSYLRSSRNNYDIL